MTQLAQTFVGCSMNLIKKGGWLISVGVLALGSLCGCSTLDQHSDQVLVMPPHKGSYNEPVGVRDIARLHWRYAVLSENAYLEGKALIHEKVEEPNAPVRSVQQNTLNQQPAAKDYEVACKDWNSEVPIVISGWRKWDFPSQKTREIMLEDGLYLEVQEKTSDPKEIVVIFEGTNFTQLSDWKSNLRWLLRFIPGFKDQYSLVAETVAAEFQEYLRQRPEEYRFDVQRENLVSTDGSVIRIVAVGHSLGGGLAHNFAYTLPQPAPTFRGPKVSEIFAFDTSPVTGWSSSKNPPRNYNVEGLVINRIFEHGEALSYVRLLTSRFPSSLVHPAIWEYRYNFIEGADPGRNHAMRGLACGMLRSLRD
jgi:hypothetical protein